MIRVFFQKGVEAVDADAIVSSVLISDMAHSFKQKDFGASLVCRFERSLK